MKVRLFSFEIVVIEIQEMNIEKNLVFKMIKAKYVELPAKKMFYMENSKVPEMIPVNIVLLNKMWIVFYLRGKNKER